MKRVGKIPQSPQGRTALSVREDLMPGKYPEIRSSRFGFRVARGY